MKHFEEYAHKYRNVRMERRDGILQMTFHSNGSRPVKWCKREVAPEI